MGVVWLAGVFTGIFPSGNYGPPPGFCFDQFCTDSPINDNPNLFVRHLLRHGLTDICVCVAQASCAD